MQIDRVLFPVTTLGPNKRIAIWTVGCPHKCYHCSNPELWTSDKNMDIAVSTLISMLSDYKNEADGVTITGGDPFFQAEELYKLLKELRNLGFNDILVYTGYSFKEVSKKYENILSLIDVIIDEPYIESLNNNVGLMGSDNQNIRILNPLLKEEYKNFRTIKRSRQNFISNNKIISVGIPNKICSR